jgi:hypothetical protein
MAKNLVVISPEYTTFVKDQIETISPNFEEVNVFVRHNPLAEIFGFLPIIDYDRFRLKSLINLNQVRLCT